MTEKICQYDKTIINKFITILVTRRSTLLFSINTI